MIGSVLRRFGVAAMFAAVMWTATGCENGGGGNDFVGTWEIYDQTAGAAARPFYIHFSDSTFFFSQDADTTGDGDPYTISGGVLTGNFTSPGVGDGAIECTIEDGVLILDFIEYWHSPANHVPYRGTKL
jgi:hypothetical protein